MYKDDYLILASDPHADQFNNGSDSHLALAINTSIEDFEIQFWARF